MVENFISDFKSWAAKPYDENGDLLDWFLFIGLLTALTFLWSGVIKRILN